MAARGVVWERGSLENGTMEGDWEGRFGDGSGQPHSQALHPTHQPHSPIVPIPYCK